MMQRTALRNLVALLSATILLLAAAGCDEESSRDLDLSRLTPSNFKGGTTPIISLSTNGNNWTWNDPHVIKDGAQYCMYASATENFTTLVRIFRLVSDDGVSWTLNPSSPVLDTGAAGTWDAGAVETPAVVYFNGNYHMFWTGYRYSHYDSANFSTSYFRIGHAVSADGISFTRDASFIVAPSGAAEDGNSGNDWYAFIVGEPAPVVFKNRIYLYFTAAGADSGSDLDMGSGASLQVIGLVTSTDGSSWSAPTRVLRPQQDIYPRKPDSNSDYWAGYSTPNAIVLNGEMHLFFDVARQYALAPAPIAETWIQEKLHHARSGDGISGWIQDDSPIRSQTDFAWTRREIRSPDAFLDGTTLRLYFAGDSLYFDNQFGIGMMSCDLSAR